jgi:hypothetical protein
MNSSRFGSRCKRPVLNAQHAAPRVSGVGFAAPSARFFGVFGSRKERTLATDQSSSLLGFCLVGRHFSGSVLAKLFACLFGAFVFAVLQKQFGVAVNKVLALRQTLKVFQPVVCFVPVNVVNLLFRVKIRHPANCHDAMQQLPTNAQVSHGVLAGRVRAVLSENFSAARNGVKVIKGAVFHAIDRKANHVVPPLVANKITFTTT